MTREIPSPTVKPTDTEISCNAVWKPDKYDEAEPETCWDANVNNPPFPRPEGSWKRMPVIWRIRCKMGDNGNRRSFETHHHDERISGKEASIKIRYDANRESAK
jgi:hypothetical protein